MSTESLAFKEWIKTEGLLFENKLADFDGAQLVFEADEYLITLLTGSASKEPLLPALGGLPFGLEQRIDSDLKHFKDAGIKPVFVFGGLDLACRDRQSIARESQKAVNILGEAWRLYDGGQGDEAVKNFGKACTYRTSHIAQYLYYHLHRRGVTVLNAPYNAAAQAVQMERDDAAHGIVGSASTLVFGARKVILSFDWEKQLVFYTEIDDILNKLMLSHDQFVDLCLLSGSSILSTIPEIDDIQSSKMAAARGVMSRANQDGFTACLQAKDDHYLGLYRRAKSAVKHMVVLQADGEIKQAHFETAPSDLHWVIGQRLPDELLAYLSRGLIATKILNWRTRQEIFETPPLDGGSASVYRTLIQDKLQSIRARSLAILTHSLHRYYQKQDVDLVCWFNESTKKPLGVVDSPSDSTRDAETWHVPESLMSKAAGTKNIDLTTSPIQYAVALLSEDAVAKSTVTPRKNGQHSLLRSTNEILINTVCRFLQDRGYINTDHTLSAWGKALKAAFEEATSAGFLAKTKQTAEAEESIFLALELLRLDLLTTKQLFTPPLSGAPIRGSDADKGNTMLLSHLACLGTFSHQALGYTGPLSRHLLAYHQITVAVRNTLRDLLEVHACNLLLSASAKRQRPSGEFTEIGSRLPFSTQPDLGLALVVKSYLDELSNENAKKANIKLWFGHATNIDGDLARAWKMWDAINAGIQAADSGIVTSETKVSWRNTDTWLKGKLDNAAAATTNGA